MDVVGPDHCVLQAADVPTAARISAKEFRAGVSMCVLVPDQLDAKRSGVVASPHLFEKVAVPGICVA